MKANELNHRNGVEATRNSGNRSLGRLWMAAMVIGMFGTEQALAAPPSQPGLVEVNLSVWPPIGTFAPALAGTNPIVGYSVYTVPGGVFVGWSETTTVVLALEHDTEYTLVAKAWDGSVEGPASDIGDPFTTPSATESTGVETQTAALLGMAVGIGLVLCAIGGVNARH